MTDQERKAMEMALDALEFSQKMGRHYEFDEYHHELAPRALYALRQALEQPDTGIDRGAWDDVPDATKWVDELRGDDGLEEPPNSTTDVVEPVAWKHDCAALLTNGIELWIDHCPHCGKPRTAPPSKPMTGWQPIETAPKTGRELILLLTPSLWPQLAYSNTWWLAGFSVETNPTHWMPIPAIETKHGIFGSLPND